MGGGVQRGDACGFGGKLALLFEGVAQALVHGDGDAAVDFGAGDLFEQRRAFVRCGAEEGGEVALGEEHGAGEALVVHAGEAFDGGGDVFEAGGKEFAAFGVGQFVFGVLEFAACFAPRAVLAPMAAVAPGAGAEGDFGVAGAAVAAHDFVACFADARKARGAAVEGEADGVEDGGFARAGRAGQGVDVVVVGGVVEVDFPGAGQGVQVGEADGVDTHGVGRQVWGSQGFGCRRACLGLLLLGAVVVQPGEYFAVILAQGVALVGGDVVCGEAALEDVQRVEVVQGFAVCVLCEDALADALVFQAQDFKWCVGGQCVQAVAQAAFYGLAFVVDFQPDVVARCREFVYLRLKGGQVAAQACAFLEVGHGEWADGGASSLEGNEADGFVLCGFGEGVR